MAAETGAIGNELYSWLMMADAAAMTTTPKKVKDMGGNESTLYLGIGKVGFNEAVAMTATSTQLNALVANNSGSNTGDQDLSPYLLSATAASTYLTQANASSTYATQASLSSYLTTAAAVLAYQPLDSDLTTIAGLTVSNDDFLQRKAGVWVNRTVAQVKTDLSLSGSNTGDQTITLTGNVTGSGTGSFATTIANGVVTVAMLSATGTPSASTFLRGDGSWAAPAGGGGGDLLAANNLSDLANAATARTNLGLVIGTNVQAYNANLTSFATVTPSANGLSLVSAANYAAMKTLLSLTIGTDVQAYNANLTTYAGIAPSANVQTLLGSANYAAFKTSLSLNNVENTALSTWAGTANITTLGTVTTGALSTGAVIGGVTMTLGSDATGDIYYRNSGGVLTRLAAGTNGHVLTLSGGLPSWAAGGGGGGSTFADNAFQVYDSVDNTKILAFESSGITTATTRTLTIPDASGTITLNDSTATLSNKTLTAPKFANAGFIADANGNEILEFETTASAVNHLKIVNDITNGDPYIEVVGDDTNVGMYMVMKGNGFFALDSSTATTGSSRGTYAVDLQLQRNSASQIASGNGAFVVGYQNTSSGSYAGVFGNNNTASGQSAFALGNTVTVSGQEAFGGGFRTRSVMRGQFAWSGGMHTTGGVTGDNQFTMLVARRYITGATTGQTGITLYIGDGASTEIIPDVTSLTYRTWTLRVRWNVLISARSGTTTGLAAADTVGAEDIIVIKKTGSTVTIVESSLGTVYGDTNLKTGLSMGYTGSGTNFRINLVAPTFAGGGSLTLKATAVLHITENGY